MAKSKHSYLINTVVAGGTIEIFKTQSARYGCRDTHAPRSSATPEQVAKVNARRTVDKIRQKLKDNFTEDDEHIALKYREDTRPSDPYIANKIMEKFLRRVRIELTRMGIEFKYFVVAASLGESNHNLHHHAVVNGKAINVIRKMWEEYGSVYTTRLYRNWQYRELAEYLARQIMPEGWSGRKYRYSKNLTTPKVNVRRVSGKTWRAEPKCPKGYRFDPDFPIENGVCSVTGYAYQRYGLLKLEPPKPRRPRPKPIEGVVN